MSHSFRNFSELNPFILARLSVVNYFIELRACIEKYNCKVLQFTNRPII